MNLSKSDTSKLSNQGVDLNILDVDGEPTDITITLLGMDSDAIKKHSREESRRLIKTSAASRKNMDVDLEYSKRLAVCTIAWENVCFGDDVPSIPCTYRYALELYSDYPFIRDQVAEFAENRANFLQPSTTSLQSTAKPKQVSTD